MVLLKVLCGGVKGFIGVHWDEWFPTFGEPAVGRSQV